MGSVFLCALPLMHLNELSLFTHYLSFYKRCLRFDHLKMRLKFVILYSIVLLVLLVGAEEFDELDDPGAPLFTKDE